MTYLEQRKQNLIERLNAISDESLLDDIEQLLDAREPILHVSAELTEKIDCALEQMRKGEVRTHQEMKQRFAKWLK